MMIYAFFSFYSFPGKWRQWNISSLKCILNWKLGALTNISMQSYIIHYTNQFLEYLDVIEDKNDMKIVVWKISSSKERF